MQKHVHVPIYACVRNQREYVYVLNLYPEI